MYFVSEITEKLKIARSTLLYYERIGLVSPGRDPGNGYRVYSSGDLQQLVMVKQLQKAGFSLTECKVCLSGQMAADVIGDRLALLENDILEMKTARDVLRALYQRISGLGPEQRENSDEERLWHAEFEKTSSDAHLQWLQSLGFSEVDAIHIRCVSRNISDHEDYMKDFFRVFEKMNRQGPGSPASTLSMFDCIPPLQPSSRILEIGCGRGTTAVTLAGATDASITAVDNHPPFIADLISRAEQAGVAHKIQVVSGSMFNLGFEDRSFDVLWSEGSAYIMGFEKALCEWKRLIQPGGYLFVSDAVWLTENPTEVNRSFWEVEYPGMTSSKERQQQAVDAGYDVIKASVLPREDWQAFYNDMSECIAAVETDTGETQALKIMKNEVALSEKYGHEYGYACLLLQLKE